MSMNADILARYGLIPVKPEALDSSALKDYVDCPSLYYLRHILGLKLNSMDPQDEAKYDYGTVWHRVQEAFHNTGDVTEALRQLDPWPRSIMAETDRHGRSKQRMATQFFEYVEKYKDDPLEWEDLRSEQFFDVYDEEYDLRWTGIIDRWMRKRANKELFLKDFKTTSAMGANYFDQYEFSFQLPGYIWAAQHLTTERIEKIQLDVMYTLKTKHEFFRRTFVYDQARLAEWRRNVKLWLDRLRYQLDNDLYEPEKWGKNWNQCTRYGLCQFAGVHFNTPEGDSRLVVLQNEYHIERWDPSKRGIDEVT